MMDGMFYSTVGFVGAVVWAILLWASRTGWKQQAESFEAAVNKKAADVGEARKKADEKTSELVKLRIDYSRALNDAEIHKDKLAQLNKIHSDLLREHGQLQSDVVKLQDAHAAEIDAIEARRPSRKLPPKAKPVPTKKQKPYQTRQKERLS